MEEDTMAARAASGSGWVSAGWHVPLETWRQLSHPSWRWDQALPDGLQPHEAVLSQTRRCQLSPRATCLFQFWPPAAARCPPGNPLSGDTSPWVGGKAIVKMKNENQEFLAGRSQQICEQIFFFFKESYLNVNQARQHKINELLLLFFSFLNLHYYFLAK